MVILSVIKKTCYYTKVTGDRFDEGLFREGTVGQWKGCFSGTPRTNIGARGLLRGRRKK